MSHTGEAATPIHSVQHPLVKVLVRLHQKKNRQMENMVLVEGPNAVREAIQSGLSPKHLWVAASQQDRFSTQHPALAQRLTATVSDAVMKKVSTTGSAPPCIAAFPPPDPVPLDNLINRHYKHAPLFLVLHQIQDPGNLGTLIRSAKAFGVDALILTPGTVDPFSPKVIRSTTGLVFSLPMVTLAEPTTASSENPLLELFNGLQRIQFNGEACQIYLTRGPVDGTLDYQHIAYEKPTAIVLGNEGHGFDDLSDTELDELGEFNSRSNLHWVTIPMAEEVDSLNVGVTGSILLANAFSRSRQPRL